MSQVQEVKDAVDIVSVIGERIDLKRAGSSYKALCPFHSENSPSFFVNSQMQRYKCFGCGASGDVIEFLEQYEGMTFLEALKSLADRAGIELKQHHTSQDDKLRETLLEILSLAQKYFHYLLTEHKHGQQARDYLEQRKISQESIKLFQLGYSLPAWDGLYSYLTSKKNYSKDQVLQTGLIIRSKTGRYYDRFRNRVMFPLKNHRGQVVGFSGRALDNDKKTPKYINTPETKLYHKSKTLYGYSELLQAIRKQNEIIISEGEFDVISSSQAHVNHIAAIKGSALTTDQAKLISRVAEQVILCLDADPAGVKATKRAIEVIKDLDLELRVIDLSQVEADFEIKDIDDLARKDPKLWRKTAKKSTSVYDFLIRVALDKFDPQTPDGKRKIVDDLAPVLNFIDHQVEKKFYIDKLADQLRVNAGMLEQDVRQFGQSQTSQLRSVDEQKRKLDPSKHLERYLLFLLFRSDPEEIDSRLEQIKDFEFNLVGADQIVNKLNEIENEFDLKPFADKLPEDLKASLFEWYQQPEFVELLPKIKIQSEWERTWKKLQRQQVQQQIEQINRQIENLESQQDLTEKEEQELQQYLNQIVDLQAKLRVEV